MKDCEMKITLCQTNFTIANFEKNFQTIILETKKYFDERLSEDHLIIFPEGALTGYPLHDLLELDMIIAKQNIYLKKLSQELPKKAHVILGAIVCNPQKPGRPFLNAALYFHQGKFKTIAKTLLPTWDVFNEERWFDPGSFDLNVIKIKNKKVLVTICEDIWGWDDKKLDRIYTRNPLREFRSKVDLVINISASPYTRVKEEQRFVVISRTARHFKAPVIYCNRWGAEDELIFDGHSLICQKNGDIQHRLKGFQNDTCHVGLTADNQIISSQIKFKSLKPNSNSIQNINSAIVCGIREYCLKNKFSKIHFGLSGGIDSALIACLAVDAIGAENVTAFALPTQYNAPESLRLAEDLANQLGIQLIEIEINALYLECRKIIDQTFNIHEFGVTHENIQSRLRGLLLMAYSNLYNSLLLSTSNKSELATGYGTLYGDMNGGLLPIGDLYKTQVFQMARWYQKKRGLIPEEIITRPPSAELRPNQKDQDSLPEYSKLDRSLKKIIEHGEMGRSKTDLFSLQKILGTEFKRWQGAPILKVSSRSFGRGRHWPISHGFKF